MKTYIALLRGINILGKNRLPMAELRAICEGLGLEQVVTYIQSGNVIFRSGRSAAAIEDLLRARIDDQYGYSINILVREPSFFERIIERNPFAGEDERSLHVTFLDSEPEAALADAIADIDLGGDRFRLDGEAVYVHCPDGYGRTKLHNNFLERKLGVSATTRNWRTTLKLREIAEDH